MLEQEVAAKPPSREDPILQEVTRRLVKACDPDRIYLFGSAARGDARPDSDYDFLMVVPDETAGKELDRCAYDAIRDLRLLKDLLIYTRTYFAERLPLVASLPATVIREGVLLYDSGRDGYNVEPARKAVDTADGMGKARDDLRAAEILLAASPPRASGMPYTTASRPPRRR